MPKNNRSTKTARRTRKYPHARKSKQKARRKGVNGARKKAPKVISNSIFALTLPERSGIEVQTLQESVKYPMRFKDPESYDRIYIDLLASFHNAYRKIYNESLKYDPLKHGFPVARAIAEVIDAFRINIVPPGFEFNVHKDEYGNDDHYFVIYKVADEDVGFWTVSLNETICNLKKQKGLHDLFIDFIHSLWLSTGINMWFEDLLGGYIEEVLEEEIHNWEDYVGDGDEELQQKEEAVRCLYSYQKGEVMEYEKLFVKAKRKPASYFISRLGRYSTKNPIVKWMKDWAELLDSKYCAGHFDYSELREEEGYEDLRFTSVFNLLWDERDAVGYKITEHLECDANNCGVAPPVINLPIKKDTVKIDIEWLKQADKWPQTICQCFRALYKAQKDHFNLTKSKK